MKKSIVRLAILLFAAMGMAACQPKDLTLDLAGSNSISGSLPEFANVNANSKMSTLAACPNSKVNLFLINEDGSRGNNLLSTLLHADGTFSFTNLYENQIEGVSPDSANTKYSIVFDCAGTIYERFVTGPVNQNLSEGLNVLSWVSQTDASDRVPGLASSIWEELYSRIAETSSATEAYSTLISNADLRQKFHQIFGIDPNALLDAPPRLQEIQVEKNLDEGISKQFRVSAIHWSMDYDVAYKWKIGSQTLSSSANFVYTPDSNSQGLRVLQLFMGRDDGSGQIDTTKPYAQKTFDLDVQNTSPAVPPAIALLSSAFTNSNLLQIRMTTGTMVDGRPFNCSSFSKLALIEESAPPVNPAPFLESSYSIDCSNSPFQDINTTLSGVEGARTLRLWAVDSSGNKSQVSSDLTVTYDVTNPVLTLTGWAGGSILRGGQTQTIDYSLTELSPAANPISIEYSSDNGATWATIASGLANTGSYDWPVPLINSTQVLVRLKAVDQAGNQGSVQSAVFQVDSTLPSAPTVSLASASASNDRVVLINVNCFADYDKVLVSDSISTPAINNLSWQDCASVVNFQVAAGDGAKNIYVWSKDSAGNISSASNSVSMTLDQTVPVVVLTSLAGGQKISGNALQIPAINQQTVTWTATDSTGFGTNPISIEYSSDGGVNWIPSMDNLANSGSYVWTVPAMNSNSFRVRVKACDVANNCSFGTSLANLLVDSASPSVTSVMINDDATYAGTAVLGVKSDITDNLSGANELQYKLASANGSTENCQSEFVDSGWVTWVSTASIKSFVVAPIDGMKKICVWAKDPAGNISVISSNSGAGSLGVDMDTIQFEIGTPPVIVSFSVTNNSSGGNQGTTTYASGEAVKIDWSISDVQGLPNQPFALAYTTDNSVWKDLTTNQDISNSNNITWLGNISGNPTTASGSYTSWSAPTSGYFRLRMVAIDNAGNFSVPALSQSQNTGRWSIFAGSNDRGDGGTGTSALLNGMDSTTSWFAIHPLTNDIYAADSVSGLRKLDVATGKVSTVIRHATLNLSSNGPLPATAQANFSTGVIIQFDNNGLLYLRSAANNGIYQIDLSARTSKLYVGGGTDNGSLSSPSNISVGDTAFAFDESNSMYLFVDCNPTTNPAPGQYEIYRIVKITQNSITKTASGLSVLAGDCSGVSIPSSFPANPVASPIGNINYARLSTVAAWNNGQYVYFSGYGSIPLKIINGQMYRNSVPLSNFSNLAYNFATGSLYGASGSKIVKIIPNLTGNLGDAFIDVAGGATTSGCSDENVSALSSCVVSGMVPHFDTSGTLYFADGSVSNNSAPYRIRYLTSDNKVRTIFGSKPFFGDGLNKSLIRGSFAGVHYKKASAPAQTQFPAGLYFMDFQGCVLGHIDEATSIANVVWGDQSRMGLPTEGAAATKFNSMGSPYGGGSCMPLAFDSNGLPWTRVGSYVAKLSSTGAVSYPMYGSTRWELAPHGASSVKTTYSIYVFGGKQNFTLKDQGLFLLGSYASLPSTDPAARLSYFDSISNTATKVMGGLLKASEGPFPSPPDLSAGQVFDADIAAACRISGCKIQYVASQDRLYYAEGSIMRYIHMPTNGAQSTLTTLFTASGEIGQFILSEDQSQLWYAVGNILRCYDFSSGKSWCDNSTNHFPYSSTLGSISSLPNTMTWKDSQTLIISSGDKILQYDLPTGP